MVGKVREKIYPYLGGISGNGFEYFLLGTGTRICLAELWKGRIQSMQNAYKERKKQLTKQGDILVEQGEH
jgi:hypothetical protein